MTDVCVLCVEGLPAVPLKPDEIYRIGKQAGLEICIADDSMELAHGVVSLLRSGIVRLAAVAGRIFVNEEEKQISDIGKKDASNGKVRLRFGNVEASLRFNEANEEAQDSSGFGECLKDRSIQDTTDDSLCIPETQPPSENVSVNTTADSFFIPETQAIVFENPTGKRGKVSLGDDFMIPETENPPDPADLPQEPTMRGSNDSESSSMGSQIRICTQDFNEFNEDAIDDFDSSLMLGDALMALGPPKAKKESTEKLDKKQENQLDATDLEMSALNWSSTNSKCNVFNSTKADEEHRASTCITPDLSAPLADANRDISTPEILELMEAHEEENVVQRSGSTTPQLCGIKQLVVATIETPRTTQNEEDEDDTALVKDTDINQDFVATQAFPSRFLQQKESPERPNQDFIATQVFPSNGNISEVRQNAEIDQDFVATQAFPSRLPQTKESPDKPYQDFVATQAFPSRLPHSKESSGKVNQDFVATQAFPSRLLSQENLLRKFQDFVATQAFPSRLPQPKESALRPNQDFVATQVFPSKRHTPARAGQDFVETQPFNFNKENVPQVTDSWSDEIEEILNEMTSGNVVSSPLSSPSEEVLQYVKPNVIKDKDHNRKVFLFENVFPNVDNENRWKNELLVEEKIGLKRTASTDGQSPFVTPSKRNRRLSDQPERLNDCSTLSCSRKRPVNLQESDKSEPPIKSMCKVTSFLEKAELSTEDEAAAPKVAVTKRPTRRGKTKSRSPTSTVNTNQGDKSEPPIKSMCKVTSFSENAELSTEDEAAAPKVAVTKRPTRRGKTKSRSPTPTVNTNQGKKSPGLGINRLKVRRTPKESPPRAIRTRRQTKCLDPEEVSTKPPEEIMTKQKEAMSEPTKEEVGNKRGAKKLVESAKKNPEEAKVEAKEEAEQSASKRGRKKTIGSAKKDSKEPKNLTKRRPGRPRNNSSCEDSISKTSMSETITPANEDKNVLEDSLKKKLVVRLKRAISLETPSTSTTSTTAPTEGNAVEGKASKNTTSAPKTRLSQENHQDPLKAFNKYVRQAKLNGKLKIAFTVCDRQALNSVIRSLKYVVDVTEDPLQCDVLIMDKGERTFKFLAAIALNKPVFNSKWLESIKSTKTITVKDEHLFNDSNFKKGFKFDPLSVMQHPRLFNGFNFLLCEGIQPNVNDMKVIIQSAGGTVHGKPPPLASSKDLYVVTTSKDNHSKQRLRNYENVHYIKTEGVMASLVQHKVDLLDEHKVKL
ncbi:LOW QUALITY PROTEIN: uncharacterized protein LOC110188883 [Drosophila serrata]|uniref:LOW QUALITY PROTEIN: uncharacterized protein LOC110188883 n=1 Tax=Drosophila serrata TaxID=7274 RepID=UPI000A1D2998|nr:LOW QUALITY PROTEIN: uncharacterized protein LOC110188883 [Drosophila serrata]